MEKDTRVLIMALLEMLQFLVMVAHHFILIIQKVTFLGEGPTEGINRNKI